MVEHNQHDCMHEELIQDHNLKINELESRANYKEKRMDDINETMKELQKTMDNLDDTINKYILQSVQDDNKLKTYIQKLENRVTALEAEKQNTRYMIGLVAIVIVALEFGIKYIG